MYMYTYIYIYIPTFYLAFYLTPGARRWGPAVPTEMVEEAEVEVEAEGGRRQAAGWTSDKTM